MGFEPIRSQKNQQIQQESVLAFNGEPYGEPFLLIQGRLEETLKEHQSILDGIRSGDISKAYKAILFHVAQNKIIISLKYSSPDETK